MLWGMSFHGMSDTGVLFWTGSILLVFVCCMAFAGGVMQGRLAACADHCGVLEHDGGFYRDGQCVCSDEVP